MDAQRNRFSLAIVSATVAATIRLTLCIDFVSEKNVPVDVNVSRT